MCYDLHAMPTEPNITVENLAPTFPNVEQEIEHWLYHTQQI